MRRGATRACLAVRGVVLAAREFRYLGRMSRLESAGNSMGPARAVALALLVLAITAACDSPRKAGAPDAAPAAKAKPLSKLEEADYSALFGKAGFKVTYAKPAESRGSAPVSFGHVGLTRGKESATITLADFTPPGINATRFGKKSVAWVVYTRGGRVAHATEVLDALFEKADPPTFEFATAKAKSMLDVSGVAESWDEERMKLWSLVATDGLDDVATIGMADWDSTKASDGEPASVVDAPIVALVVTQADGDGARAKLRAEIVKALGGGAP